MEEKRRAVHYTVVSNTDLYDLQVDVGREMKKGWEPVGGVSAVTMRTNFFLGRTIVFMQAMVS